MEDISRRIEFRDRVIKRQGVDKLVEAVIARHKPTGLIKESTTESTELGLLFEKCGDADVLVCNSACNGLLSLVQRGHIDATFLLRRIINQAAVARSLSGIISLVTTILMTHIDSTNLSAATFAIPFSIHERPHPYIIILKTQPSCWRLLIGQIQRLLETNQHQSSAKVLQLFAPFIKYVLVDPSLSSTDITPLKSVLATSLLSTVSPSGECFRNLSTLLLDCIAMMQVDSLQRLDEVACLLDSLGRYLLLSHSPDVTSQASENSHSQGAIAVYVGHVLSLVKPLLQHGSDPAELLRLVVNIADRFIQETPRDPVIVHCADLLSILPDSCLPHCLKLASLALTRRECDTGKQESVTTAPPNRILVSMLALPTLHILASVSESSSCQSSQLIIASLARSVMAAIELYEVECCNLKISEQKKELIETEEPDTSTWLSPSYSSYRLKSFIYLARTFLINSAASSVARNWLNNLTTSLTSAGNDARLSSTVPNLIVCLVSGLLVDADTAESARCCLQALQAVCKRDTAQSVRMLPLLLYKLKKSEDCRVRLELLHSLPRLATDRLAVAPVLSAIQLFSCTPSLRPLSLRLLSHLWQLEDRCFPHLMRMLNESAAGGGGAAAVGRGGASGEEAAHLQTELLLARAACISDICSLRPSQHGEDMLSPLSDILNQCTRADQAPAVCLSLTALSDLCEAEVIDLRTAWVVLAPKLCQDRRPLVLVIMCRMLSLAADMEIETEEFQTFLSDVLDRLWTLTRHTDPRVSSAAYLSLSHFPRHLHSSHHLSTQEIKQLPDSSSIVTSVAGAAAKSVSTGKISAASAAAVAVSAAEEGEDEEESVIAGEVFVNLVKDVKEAVLKDCTTFLRALIGQELESMPRGLRGGRDRVGGSMDEEVGGGVQNRVVASLPGFIQDQHQNNRDPSTRSGLALARLFTYDPSLMAPSRDARSQSRRVATRGRDFHQSLRSLIEEVSMDPADWYQCQVKGQAWLSFMDRCYTSYIDMRMGELREAVGRESSEESIEENRILRDGAWLWARDKLADLIKGLSRGRPGVQCNSVYAICALAAVSNEHASRLDEAALKSASTLSEHVGQTYWLKMISETLLTILDPSYQPTGRLMGLCGRKNTTDPHEMTPTSVQSRAGAAAGFALLAVPLAATSFNIVQSGLDLLCANLPGVAADTVPDIVQMHCGIGVGGVISALVSEGCTESLMAEEVEAVWRAIKELEKSAFSGSENRTGSIGGLSACLTSLCRDGKARSSSEVLRILDNQLIIELRDQFSAEDPNSEALAVGVASISGAAYQANIIPPTRVEEILSLLQKQNEAESVGVSRAVGILLYVLQSSNHHSARDLIRCQSNQWAAMSSNQDSSTNEKLSAMCGLLSLAGTHRIVSPTVTTDCGGALLNELGVLNDVTRLLKALIGSSSADNRLRHCCAWLAGLFHRTMALSEDIRVTVPINYHYLPETSLLRAAVDLLIDISKSDGQEFGRERIHAVLKCLNTKQALPPLNWSAILSPILRQSHGVDVELACIEIVIQRSAHTPSVARFLSTLVTPPLYFTLHNETKLKILREVATFLKPLPLAALTAFSDRIVAALFSTATNTASNTASNMASGQVTLSSSTSEATGHQIDVGSTSADEDVTSAVIGSPDVMADVIGWTDVSDGVIGGNIRLFQKEALIGLRDALASSGTLSEMVRGFLWKLLAQVYSYFCSSWSVLSSESDNNENKDLMTLLADCLALVPDSIVDSVITQPPTHLPIDQLGEGGGWCSTRVCELYVRCGLISRGAQPVAWISKSVEDLVTSNNLPQQLHGQCLYQLMCALETVGSLGAHAVSNQVKLEWFVELLGYSRSIVSRLRSESSADNQQVIQSSRMVVLIVFSVFLCWSDSLSSHVLSLQRITKYSSSSSASSSRSTASGHSVVASPGNRSTRSPLSTGRREDREWSKNGGEVNRLDMLEGLIQSLVAESMSRLLSVEPWRQATGKVVDWLLVSQEAFSSVSTLHHTRSTLLECLYGLRHTEVFKKSNIWSRAAVLI